MTSQQEEMTSRLRNEALAEFRYALRRFLHFSEEAATRAGLQPQQHQLMLQIEGARAGTAPTISYVAERLGLRHHSVVELSKRCEEEGLIVRRTALLDRRQIILQLTAAGQKALAALSDDHVRELDELAPRLIRALGGIKSAHARASLATGQAEGLE